MSQTEEYLEQLRREAEARAARRRRWRRLWPLLLLIVAVSLHGRLGCGASHARHHSAPGASLADLSTNDGHGLWARRAGRTLTVRPLTSPNFSPGASFGAGRFHSLCAVAGARLGDSPQSISVATIDEDVVFS